MGLFSRFFSGISGIAGFTVGDAAEPDGAGLPLGLGKMKVFLCGAGAALISPVVWVMFEPIHEMWQWLTNGFYQAMPAEVRAILLVIGIIDYIIPLDVLLVCIMHVIAAKMILSTLSYLLYLAKLMFRVVGLLLKLL